jgi:hypothetical protein
MFCGQCGKSIEDDSLFCRHCGTAQKPPAALPASPQPTTGPTEITSDPSPPQKSGIAGLLVLVGGLLVVGLVVGSIGRSPTSVAVSGQPGMSIVNSADAAAAEMDAAADNLSAMADPQGEASTSGGNWSYSTDEDKVRGGTSYFASTTSTNTLRQSPPYDADTTMRMIIRQSPANGTDVVLTISSGQLMCPSYEGCSGTVRFDSGPAERVSFSGPADNSSDTIFVDGARSFIAKLKKAKKMIVEKTVYEAGNPQFEFDVANLKWDH